MIERLFDEEHWRDSPAYKQYIQQITEERKILDDLLDEEGRACLERLTVAYLRQNSVVLKEGFVQGFCTAVELLLESLRHRPG